MSLTNKPDLTYVRFILSSKPTSNIILDLSNDEIHLVWEENGEKHYYLLEKLRKENRKSSEKFWREFIQEYKGDYKELSMADNEIHEEVQRFIVQTIQRNKK